MWGRICKKILRKRRRKPLRTSGLWLNMCSAPQEEVQWKTSGELLTAQDAHVESGVDVGQLVLRWSDMTKEGKRREDKTADLSHVIDTNYSLMLRKHDPLILAVPTRDSCCFIERKKHMHILKKDDYHPCWCGVWFYERWCGMTESLIMTARVWGEASSCDRHVYFCQFILNHGQS